MQLTRLDEPADWVVRREELRQVELDVTPPGRGDRLAGLEY